MNSTNSTNDGDVFSLAGTAVLSSTMFLLALSSLLCNVLVAITFCRSRDLLSVTCNKFILNMLFINIFTALLVLPFAVASSIQQDWIFRRAWCQMNAFLLILLSCALLFTLAALSYDRYYFIVKPLRHPIHMSLTRANVMICVIWLCSLFTALLPLLGWGEYGFQPTKLSCTVLWHSYSSGGYSKFFCTISIFLPLLIIIGSYFHILRAVHKQVRGGRLSLGSIISPSEYIQAQNHQRAIETRADHSRAKAWKTFVLHVGSNILCWFPYSICILVETLRGSNDVIDIELQTIAVVLAFSSVLWCPIIYAFRVKVVRREINSFLRRTLRLRSNRVRAINPDECSFVIETPAAFRNRSASLMTIKGLDILNTCTEVENSCSLAVIPEHDIPTHDLKRVSNSIDSNQQETEITDLAGSCALPGQIL